jgi:hypothetical protein
LDDFYRDALEDTKEGFQKSQDQLKKLFKDYQTVGSWLLAVNGQQDNAPPMLRCGFMLKKGDRVKNWKRRFFVLKGDGEIAYYADKDNPKPRGVINLKDATNIVSNSPASSSSVPSSPSTSALTSASSSSTSSNVIDIHTPGRVWCLHFDSDQQKQQWLTTMSRFSGAEAGEVAEDEFSGLL